MPTQRVYVKKTAEGWASAVRFTYHRTRNLSLRVLMLVLFMFFVAIPLFLLMAPLPVFALVAAVQLIVRNVLAIPVGEPLPVIPVFLVILVVVVAILRIVHSPLMLFLLMSLMVSVILRSRHGR